MDFFKTFKDSKHCIPTEIGEYEMLNKWFGGKVKVLWDGKSFTFLNGDKIPDGVCRLWR